MNNGENRKMWMWLSRKFHCGILHRYKHTICAGDIGCAVCDVTSPFLPNHLYYTAHSSSSFNWISFECHSLTSPNMIFISATIITVHKRIPHTAYQSPTWMPSFESMFQALKNRDTHGWHHNKAKIATNPPATFSSYGRETMSWLHKNTVVARNWP